MLRRAANLIAAIAVMALAFLGMVKAGGWYLHCHHLYHMATGMMTELRVT